MTAIRPTAKRFRRMSKGLAGGAGNDLITGSAASNVLRGGPGNDTVIPGAGSDTLDGGAGNDSVDYSATTTGVSGIANLLGLTVHKGASSADSSVRIETIIGGSGDDHFGSTDTNADSLDLPENNNHYVFYGNGGDDSARLVE